MKKQNRNAFAYISTGYFTQGSLMFSRAKTLSRGPRQATNLPTIACLMK